jgi:hypothetical protein
MPAQAQTIHADLLGYQEVPALSTGASGDFRAKIDKNPSPLTYELTYENLSAAVEQAHVHVGQAGMNGGIANFLRTHPSNGPAGQGIAADEFAEVLAAIQAGVAHVNVHLAAFPGGEIRGQIK